MKRVTLFVIATFLLIFLVAACSPEIVSKEEQQRRVAMVEQLANADIGDLLVIDTGEILLVTGAFKGVDDDNDNRELVANSLHYINNSARRAQLWFWSINVTIVYHQNDPKWIPVAKKFLRGEEIVTNPTTNNN